jgi:arabinofuranosyltransferase
VPLALGLAARIDAARAMPYAAEDAYITFRFAENWARGLGPVYNAGERVLGFTSPAWTAWVALGARFGIDSFTWARWWGLVLSLVALVLLTRLLDRAVGRTAAWLFAVFFAVFAPFSAHAVLGMETSLLIAAMAAAATAIEARSRAAGPLLALLALTRPEGAALSVLLALRADGRARLVALGLVGLVAGALAAYYGNPIPQSVLAKAGTYGLGLRAASLLWLEGFLPAFLAPRWQTLLEAQHLFAISELTAPAAVLGLRALGPWWPWPPRPSVLGWLAAGAILVLCGYVALGVPYFAWYFVLPLTGWAIAVAAGLPRVVRSRLVWAALAVYVLTDAAYLGRLYVGRNQVEARLFVAAAERLAAHSGGRGSVFLEPIGHIGYRTGLTVIDEIGLVSPEVPRMRRRGAGWYADVVAARRPDYLVFRPGPLLDNRPLAGVAAPFRSVAERDSTLVDYDLVGNPPQGPDELVVLVKKTRMPPGRPVP